MHKATAIAHADVALIKYWGKKDERLRLPENGSLSIILSELSTTTTVEFNEVFTSDSISINGEVEEGETERVVEHLERIRQISQVKTYARVVSENSFPRGTGLSSSGSGFAALTVAGLAAVGKELTQQEMSVLARQGSGTACRCVVGGWAEWKDGNSSDSSYSVRLFPHDYWDLRDVVVVVSNERKKVTSTSGHTTAKTSPFFQERQKQLPEKMLALKQAIGTKDFTSMGEIVEAEALEFHSILLTSKPALIAWYPGTIEVMLKVQELRVRGIRCYFTINTGFNVHVITLPEHVEMVSREISALPTVTHIFDSNIGGEPWLIDEHLF